MVMRGDQLFLTAPNMNESDKWVVYYRLSNVLSFFYAAVIFTTHLAFISADLLLLGWNLFGGSYFCFLGFFVSRIIDFVVFVEETIAGFVALSWSLSSS